MVDAEMETYSAVLLFAACLLCARSQLTQCPLIQGSELGRMDTASTDGLISEAFIVQAGDNDPRPEVLLFDFSIVCLASGSTREMYQFVSVVASYLCNGAQSECNGATLLSQFEFGCVDSGSGPEWRPNIGGSTDNIRTTPADGTLNTTVRTDCSICVSPIRISSANNINHCLPCNAACTGLGLCTNSLQSGCCNFFQNDSCVVQCTSGFVPDSNNSCVLDPCIPNPCDPNAICQRIGTTSSFTCTCVSPFTGDGSTCTRVIADMGGDPHFSIVLPSGKLLCYNVQGKHGLSFNLIHSKTLHMNAMFVPDSKRKEVTWLGSIGVVVANVYYQGLNVTKLKFDVNTKKVHIGKKVTLKVKNIKEMTFSNGRLTISENHPKDRSKKPAVRVNVDDVGLSFTIRFTGNHLDVFWHHVGEQRENFHGLIGQFFQKGVEVDTVRKLLILPGKKPVPVMHRPVWKFMEREVDDNQLCWTAMNPGNQGKGLIDGTYLDYLVNDVLSNDFEFRPKERLIS